MSKWFKLPLSVIRRDGLILKEGQPMQSSANVTLYFLIFRSIFPQTLHLSVSWITQGPRTKSSPVWPRGSSCDKSPASASGVWKCCWGYKLCWEKRFGQQKDTKRTHVCIQVNPMDIVRDPAWPYGTDIALSPHHWLVKLGATVPSPCQECQWQRQEQKIGSSWLLPSCAQRPGIR